MTAGKNDNLALWSAVERTDPKYTKQVSQRGGFTAIASYYTIKRLTEQFGPLGLGWGWSAQFEIEDGIVVCVASFWYERDGKRAQSTPIMTMNQLFTEDRNGKRHVDEDAGKKALTDAMTKWASYLGFSADVFEGKFDDNRYVQAAEAEFRRKENKEARGLQAVQVREEVDELVEEARIILASVEDVASYQEARKRMIPVFLRLKALSPDSAREIEASMQALTAAYTGEGVKNVNDELAERQAAHREGA